jgi:hypothetical protein
MVSEVYMCQMYYSYVFRILRKSKPKTHYRQCSCELRAKETERFHFSLDWLLGVSN